jgi:hypothetical protein
VAGSALRHIAWLTLAQSTNTDGRGAPDDLLDTLFDTVAARERFNSYRAGLTYISLEPASPKPTYVPPPAAASIEVLLNALVDAACESSPATDTAPSGVGVAISGSFFDGGDAVAASKLELGDAAAGVEEVILALEPVLPLPPLTV